jgi:hypothetical protein
VPTVARVEGAKIQVYASEHPPAHFHVAFAEYRAQIDIEALTVLKGSLPHAKLATVVAWARPRREALKRAWDMTVAKKKPEKIP